MPRPEKKSGNCEKCGITRLSLHRDHINPRWKGGGDEPENIQWICANCHEDKTRSDLRGIPGPNKGRTFGPEARLRMSLAMSASQRRGGRTKGHRWTEAQRAKHSVRLREVFAVTPKTMPPASEERKRKVSESLRRYWEQRRTA